MNSGAAAHKLQEAPVRYREMVENHLIDLAVRGDQGAFTEIYQRYCPRLIRFVSKQTHDVETAEDLVQEVFFRVFKHLANFDQTRKFTTWIYTIASNLVKNNARNRKRRPVVLMEDMHSPYGDDNRPIEFEDPRSNVQRIVERKELRRFIESAISRLPPHHREVFFLREMAEFSYEEISLITEAEIGTVKSRLNRARSEFAEELQHLYGGSDIE